MKKLPHIQEDEIHLLHPEEHLIVIEWLHQKDFAYPVPDYLGDYVLACEAAEMGESIDEGLFSAEEAITIYISNLGHAFADRNKDDGLSALAEPSGRV